jgi:predicted porin
MKSYNKSILLSICLLFFSGQSASAESDKEFNSWQNTLAPLYLWGVSMSGNITSGPVSAPLNIEFSDAVSDLEGIFTLHYEGAKGNWGVILDYSFLNLTPSATVPGTPAQINVDMKNTIAEIAGLYRFGPNNPWQLLAGYRSYKLDVTINGLPSPPLPTSQIVIDETINDIFIGGRYMGTINDKWSFVGRVDVGAGDSDLVWNALAAFDYRFNKLLSAFVGWKVLDYDVDNGSGTDTFKYDMNHSGPIMALAFHW